MLDGKGEEGMEVDIVRLYDICIELHWIGCPVLAIKTGVHIYRAAIKTWWLVCLRIAHYCLSSPSLVRKREIVISKMLSREQQLIGTSDAKSPTSFPLLKAGTLTPLAPFRTMHSTHFSVGTTRS